jgi:parallel beta-helix repeat protein
MSDPEKIVAKGTLVIDQDDQVVEGMIFDNVRIGVYVKRGVKGTVIRDCAFVGNAQMGIYLDADSTGAIIEGCTFRDNGWRYSRKNGKRGIWPRLSWARREGIAIDGSSENIIHNCVFSGNALAGITLYKNCAEYNGPPRCHGSNDNLIYDCSFRDEKIGIWIASRQSRDLTTWECGDLTPYPNPLPAPWKLKNVPYSPWFNPGSFVKPFWRPGETLGWDDFPIKHKVGIWPDEARRNTVRAITFVDCGTGVLIEDDDNEVSACLFDDCGKGVAIGGHYREQYLGRPVRYSGSIEPEVTV